MADSDGRSSLLDELCAYIRAQHPPERSALLCDLAGQLLRRADDGETGRAGLDVLAGHVEALLDFIDERRAEPFAVRVRTALDSATGRNASVLEVNADDAPFLVDSVTGELKEQGFSPRRVVHPVVGIERAHDGRLVSVTSARDASRRESVQHYELGREVTNTESKALTSGVAAVLTDVLNAVRDFGVMTERTGRMIEIAKRGAYHYSQEEVDEAVAFLQWLLDDNFVFLGYREYEIFEGRRGKEIQVVEGSGLGVLGNTSASNMAQPVLIDDLPDDRKERYLSGNLLVITKTNRSSTVHRRARMDYIGVRHIGPNGQIAGEARLIGLFTAKAYMAPSSTVPLLRRKLDWIIEKEDLIEGSHDHRAVVQAFDSFPKEELFSVPREELAKTIGGLLDIEEQRHVRLFVRSDLLRRNVSVMVAMPRDRFNARLRKQLQQLILDRFAGESVDYRLALGDGDLARIHFTVWTGDQIPEVSFSELESEVVALTRNWDDRLAERMVEEAGVDRGLALAERWASRFPEYYKTSTPLEIAVGDVLALSHLDQADSALHIGVQNEPESAEGLTRLSFYHRGHKLALSDMMPLLEHLGLNVIEEVPTRLRGEDTEILIHDFGVLGEDGKPLDLDRCADRIRELIFAVWNGTAESDSLSRLIVNADLDYDDVAILRAYRTYWRRVDPQFTLDYVNDTLAAHPQTTGMLVHLFRARFDPAASERDEAVVRSSVLAAIDVVESLDEDRILRGFVQLIDATVRTNAFRRNRRSLAIKLRSKDVPGMPKPRPLFEIFVYAAEVEGIHLRGGMVARGGLRWSDRKEDYRTEVLGLMKAQMTKNAVIVPTGAKGGFVLRHAPVGDVREAVRAAYEIFVSGLLDVTDNRDGGRVVTPEGVRAHDGPDPYLVVAADKGTAALSDEANRIAARYGFWLGDAFASGGSAGYDHKALGITARGAWESVKHHFHEMGVDVGSESIRVVGIGDMSGDVFGNGMLLSEHLQLVAAFDHRHIFIDPNPDPMLSYAERERLFAAPTSSWDDYDRSLISRGGDVYPRTMKRIELSQEAREALGTERGSLTPTELIHEILQAPVDLLWNGGIGTYVKASDEPNVSVGDRANDAVRVDGRQLRCRVVGEGGNLGLTQRGRIEYALTGGRINTDFIDNSGGVHCSDREVNLKVLLGLAVERGDLTTEERDVLIADLADDVTRRVTYDNFLQAQILTQEHDASPHRLDGYEDLMQGLEESGLLDRSIEWLPASDLMAERGRTGTGMATPELAVLLAYAKRQLTDRLLASDLPDAEAFQSDLLSYFPDRVVERFPDLVRQHPLRRELIATVVANEVINSEGVTFIGRLSEETGGDAPWIVRAYRIARIVTDAGKHWSAIEALEGKIGIDVQHELMTGVDDLVEATARWYLMRGQTHAMPLTIERTQEAFAELADELRSIGDKDWVATREARVEDLAALGVPEMAGRRHAYRRALVHAPDIIELARTRHLAIDHVARLSFCVGARFHLDTIATRLAELPRTDRWQRAAARTVADDLLRLRRHLIERVVDDAAADVAGGADAGDVVAAYVAKHSDAHERLVRLMRSVALEGNDDVAALVVAVRRIEGLVA